ncbi:hypothetical protein RND71_009733 [Anisodus tanguticus]|uniref:Uncharacterized protein n=1 Tax=Anisodus tanguticus TaxID=243964 RepID=A0AAE1SFY5_9SOLA|nr:hypothetical protein RND71_009733 [Anisodus tanguticus]
MAEENSLGRTRWCGPPLAGEIFKNKMSSSEETFFQKSTTNVDSSVAEIEPSNSNVPVNPTLQQQRQHHILFDSMVMPNCHTATKEVDEGEISQATQQNNDSSWIHSPIGNRLYDPAFAVNDLPVDPHLRMLEENSGFTNDRRAKDRQISLRNERDIGPRSDVFEA